MLSPDRSEPPVGGMRRRRRRTRPRTADPSTAEANSAPGEATAAIDPNAPWDVASAEALTRLYESEEGNLSRPAPPQPARFVPAHAGQDPAHEPVDKTWLEAHLTRLARRLQGSLAQSNPKQSLEALNERLDAFEQRFSAALGRVAQRPDLESLKSIEASVVELATQLDRARDRLELIGDVDEEVRQLARKLDESGAQRAGALERLLRDCMAEWRESEQRTASALHNLEEAVGRLGDTVDAMEASKPAPELAVPPFVATELERSTTAATDSLSRLRTGNGRLHPASFYHSMLDAADYAPRPAEQRSGIGVPAGQARLPAAAVEWSPAETDLGRAEASAATPGGWQVMAMREKLRRAPMDFDATSPDPPPHAEAPPDTLRRASLNYLLMAGAAVLAGTTYLLSRTVAAGSSVSGSDARPADGEELADPTSQRLRRESAG